MAFDDIVRLGFWRRWRVERCISATKLEANNLE
jgi:hypothetical protein